MNSLVLFVMLAICGAITLAVGHRKIPLFLIGVALILVGGYGILTSFATTTNAGAAEAPAALVAVSATSD